MAIIHQIFFARSQVKCFTGKQRAPWPHLVQVFSAPFRNAAAAPPSLMTLPEDEWNEFMQAKARN